jgi:prepilin-type N-terminal cleavage/methylation domain-containing protein
MIKNSNLKFIIWNSRSGFTLIELLVVIAIIGVLAAVVLVTTGTTRIKGRDARRLSDLQQVKSGLDIYYNLGSGYPDTATWDAGQTALTPLSCSGVVAFKPPQDPKNANDSSFAYTYTQGGTSNSGCGGTVYSNYKIQFKTEGVTSIGVAGTYYLSPAGISTTAPF